MQTFRANGKLLLTGEYFVLDGVKALALPTRLGQNMMVETVLSEEGKLYWKAFDADTSCWIDAVFDLKTLEILSEINEVTRTLQKLLLEIKSHNKLFFNSFENSLNVSTYLEFSKNWGLGSSSTLISLLSQWSGVNPYHLLESSFGGSGYDIACATSNSPIFYQILENNRLIESTTFQPTFAHQLYFVYLGKKQNSRTAIQCYRSKGKPTSTDLHRVQMLSDAMVFAPDLKTFQKAISEHEEFIGKYLDLQPIQQQLFANFDGAIKSLGGWGGDFILVATELDSKMVMDYFRVKGFDIIFEYEALI